MMYKFLTLIILFSAFANAQNADGLNKEYFLADSYEKTGDYEKALKLYEEIYQKYPSNFQFVTSLNRIYIQLKNYAASINLLEKRIADLPDDINAYGMLGSTYYLMGNEEKAYEVWDAPFELLESNSLFYRVVANYAVERRAFEKAIELYERGKDVSDDKIIFSYDLARLYSLTMQFEKAAEEYCSILLINPDELTSVESRILQLANKPGAMDIIIPVVETRYDEKKLSLKFLLARLYTEVRLFENAIEIYEEIDSEQSNQGGELFNYANFLFREKEYGFAAEIYSDLIERYPNSSIIPHLKLGNAKTLEAILFEKYTATLPLWKPYFPSIAFPDEETESVLEAFDEVARLYTHSEHAYESILRMGMIKYYLLNRKSEAENHFNKIISEAPLSRSSAEAYSELAGIALMKGNLEEAKKKYLGLLASPSAHTRIKNLAKYKLARIEFYKGNFSNADSLLSEILDDLKDEFANDALELSLILNASMNDTSHIMKFANAEFLVEQKRFGEAAEIFKSISEIQQAYVLHSVSSLRYAEMILAGDDLSQAISILESVVSEAEKNIYADKALYLLGKIYHYGLKDNVKALESYNRLLTLYPNSIYIDDTRKQINKLRNKVS